MEAAASEAMEPVTPATSAEPTDTAGPQVSGEDLTAEELKAKVTELRQLALAAKRNGDLMKARDLFHKSKALQALQTEKMVDEKLSYVAKVRGARAVVTILRCSAVQFTLFV